MSIILNEYQELIVRSNRKSPMKLCIWELMVKLEKYIRMPGYGETLKEEAFTRRLECREILEDKIIIWDIMTRVDPRDAETSLDTKTLLKITDILHD